MNSCRQLFKTLVSWKFSTSSFRDFSLLSRHRHNFLTPTTHLLNLSHGMKWVQKPRRRCSSCYFYVEDEVLYVNCTEKPRHKQGTLRYRPKFSMILSHATQGAGRAKKGGIGRMEMWTQNSFRLDY